MSPADYPNNTTLKPLYEYACMGNVIFAIGVLYFLLLVYSAFWISRHTEDKDRHRAILIGAAFTIIPPIYFFFEIFLFRAYGNHSQFDQFKHIQEAASKIWIAGVGLLYGLYTKNFPK